MPRFIDIINPYKWRAFLQGTQAAQDVGLSYCEQVVFRSVLCRPCITKGKCVDCSCKMPDAIMAKDNYCSGGNWNAMLSDEQWENFKEASGLHFTINY